MLNFAFFNQSGENHAINNNIRAKPVSLLWYFKNGTIID